MARTAIQQMRDVGLKDKMPARPLPEDTLALLNAYSWPGNIRELRNLMERFSVLHPGEQTLKPDHLPSEFHDQPRIHRPAISLGKTSLVDAVNAYEKELVENALSEARGIQTRAAEMLGTTRRILKYRMEKLNISGDRSTYR